MYIIVVTIGRYPKHYHYLSPVQVPVGTKVLVTLGNTDKIVTVTDCIDPSTDKTPYPIEQMKYIAGVVTKPDISKIPTCTIGTELSDILLKLGFVQYENEDAYFRGEGEQIIYYHKGLDQTFTFKDISRVITTEETHHIH
jgi:hypothetical protein